MKNFKELIYNQHDVVCNQKYGDDLPYSFHLKAVETQGKKFLHLIKEELTENPDNYRASPVYLTNIVKHALTAHDTLEDARLTYNDVLNLASESLDNYVAGRVVADIVYCVTDEKGKTRGERKNDKYYKELSENKLAVFVKLADLSSNILYSKLTGGGMYEKYKSELPKFKSRLHIEQYKEFFEYLENL